MSPSYFEFSPPRRRMKSSCCRGKSAGADWVDEGFVCKQCHVHVCAASFLSGVHNRNHCPYCLWSRHLDWYEAGDRLSACKALMRPIGLTVKATRKKYAGGRGELMLIHLCMECAALSINRIAADDISQAIFNVYEASFHLDVPTRTRLDANGIRILAASDRDLVCDQLFGAGSDWTGMLFGSKVSESV